MRRFARPCSCFTAWRGNWPPGGRLDVFADDPQPAGRAGPALLGDLPDCSGRAEGGGARLSHAGQRPPRMLSPVINFGAGNLDSQEFSASCAELAAELGVERHASERAAWNAGCAAQREFDGRGPGRAAGARWNFARRKRSGAGGGAGPQLHHLQPGAQFECARRFCASRGRLAFRWIAFRWRDAPLFDDMYWGYGQTILRAAHQVAPHGGVYALYCSNYSCGPDSFNLHFRRLRHGRQAVRRHRDGRPFRRRRHADAGGGLSALRRGRPARGAERRGAEHFENIQFPACGSAEIRRREGQIRKRCWFRTSARRRTRWRRCFAGGSSTAERLPAPDAESLRIGRRHTSGKECLPMPLTLGSLIQRLDRAPADEKFVYLMPSTDGPCRLWRLQFAQQHRARPARLARPRAHLVAEGHRLFRRHAAGDGNAGVRGNCGQRFFACRRFSTSGPWKRRAARRKHFTPGACANCWRKSSRRRAATSRSARRCGRSRAEIFWHAANCSASGREFAALRGPGDLPCVELTGEIYVRGVDFGNDFLIEKLEARGLRVHSDGDRMDQLLRPHPAAIGRPQPVRGRVQPVGAAAD